VRQLFLAIETGQLYAEVSVQSQKRGTLMQYKQLTLEQRYQIKALLTAGYSIEHVANIIKVHRTTVYRELARNKYAKRYDPTIASQKAFIRRHYSKKKKRLTPEMSAFIRDKIKTYWSPEQIYGYCKKHGIDMVCHESIYKYIENNKAIGGSLYKYLRQGKKRKRKYGSLKRAQNIKNRVSIENRPKVVDTRIRIGDWEADLVIGKNHKGALLTLVDRCSRYTLAKLLPNKTAAITKKAILELLEPLKDFSYTITFDNGSEFAFHEKIANTLNIKAFFAHPYSSWERGTNENTNGLIRQFIPKKSSFDGLTDGYVKKIVKNINLRPRKVLGFSSSAEVFAEGLIV